MDPVTIELHSRRAEDLPTLRAIGGALEEAGESVTLTAVAAALGAEPGVQPGPLQCRIRVLVEGEGDPAGPTPERWVVIEDRIAAPGSSGHSGALSKTLEGADLILVPGPSRVAQLEGRVSAPVVAAGVARFDAAMGDPRGARSRARRELSVPMDARVVLCLSSADPLRSDSTLLGDRITELAAAGWLVLIAADEASAGWVERHRALVARVPGMAMVEARRMDSALLAADVVVGDGGRWMYEALVLGRKLIWLEGRDRPVPSSEDRSEPPHEDLAPRASELSELQAELARVSAETAPAGRYEAARTALSSDLAVCPGRAARRMAEEIRTRFVSAPAPESDRGSGSEANVLESIEARIAFGDTQGARAVLDAQVAAWPSSRAYRALASLTRREGAIEESRRAVQSAEPLAREELARVFCERARIHVESDEMDLARGAFEEAARTAPALADSWVGLGSLALHVADAAGAERHFREALHREKSALIWAGLGLALQAAGRSQEAISIFESALDLEPDHLLAVYGIVQAAFQCGEIATAERRVHAFVELHSGNLDLVFTLAGLRQQLGDREGALQMLDRIELFKPDYSGLRELRDKLNG